MMGEEYSRALRELKIDADIVCRSEKSALAFYKRTKIMPLYGGLKKYMEGRETIPETAIVAVNVSSLYSSCRTLLEYGVKKILLEKPGALYAGELKKLKELAEESEAEVYIAYNRRFYDTVVEAEKIIEEDGGVRSFRFEFTEWSHKIEDLVKEGDEKSRWFLSNSSHVADLAFFLGGKPEEINCYSAGSLPWHPSSSIFSGSGRSAEGALFSYSADWESAGSWGIELQTEQRRIILKPLEQLMIQKKGSVLVERIEPGEIMDSDFKPGILRMLKIFFGARRERLCTIGEQEEAFEYYLKMANYNQPDES